MANGYTCCIDIDRLNSSVETLVSISNAVNNIDLTENFQEISDELKEINFEHDNCISFYKEELDRVCDELNTIKKNINSLTESLAASVEKFSSTEELTSNDIRELSKLYSDTNSSKCIDELINKNMNIKVSDNILEFKNNIDDSIQNFLVRSKLTDFPKEYQSFDDWKISLQNKYSNQNLDAIEIENRIEKEMAVWRQEQTGSAVTSVATSDYAEHQTNIQVMSEKYMSEYKLNKQAAKELANLKEQYNIMKQQENITTSALDSVKNAIDHLEQKFGITMRKTNLSQAATAMSNSNISLIGQSQNTNVTVIPTPESPLNQQTQTAPINTIPIGLGIAASGISASVGTVIVDSMNSNNKTQNTASTSDFDELEIYNDDSDIIDVENNYMQPEDAVMSSKQIDEVMPYHAARDINAINKFYADELDNKGED